MFSFHCERVQMHLRDALLLSVCFFGSTVFCCSIEADDAVKLSLGLRTSKKLVGPTMGQLNNVLKVLNVGVISGGKVAASMKSANDRGLHVLKLYAHVDLALQDFGAEDTKQIGIVLLPIKAFFTEIRKAGDMIVPLIKESLGEDACKSSFLLNYFVLKDAIDIQTYLEKLITTRHALVLFCKEMVTFCGDVQASFSEDVLKLQETFKLEQKLKNKEKVDKASIK